MTTPPTTDGNDYEMPAALTEGLDYDVTEDDYEMPAGLTEGLDYEASDAAVFPVSPLPIVISEACACERNDWERRPGTDGTLIVCRQCGKVGAVDEAPGTISVHCVTLDLCSLCITGTGGQCHTPGCSLWIHAAPDVPVSLSPAPESQTRRLSAEQLRASRLAGRIDQLIGWAKSGQRPEYPARAKIYILEAENADRLRNDIIDVIVAELGDPDAEV